MVPVGTLTEDTTARLAETNGAPLTRNVATSEGLPAEMEPLGDPHALREMRLPDTRRLMMVREISRLDGAFRMVPILDQVIPTRTQDETRVKLELAAFGAKVTGGATTPLRMDAPGEAPVRIILAPLTVAAGLACPVTKVGPLNGELAETTRASFSTTGPLALEGCGEGGGTTALEMTHVFTRDTDATRTSFKFLESRDALEDWRESPQGPRNTLLLVELRERESLEVAMIPTG